MDRLYKCLIFFCISFPLIDFFCETSIANEYKNFSIISDSQVQTNNGDFEANGNVIINNKKNFQATCDYLQYKKKDSKINLYGNVNIQNYESENILIENLISDEFILFMDGGGFEINSNEGKRVETNLIFLN